MASLRVKIKKTSLEKGAALDFFFPLFCDFSGIQVFDIPSALRVPSRGTAGKDTCQQSG